MTLMPADGAKGSASLHFDVPKVGRVCACSVWPVHARGILLAAGNDPVQVAVQILRAAVHLAAKQSTPLIDLQRL